jgi:hypothetical protein
MTNLASNKVRYRLSRASSENELPENSVDSTQLLFINFY